MKSNISWPDYFNRIAKNIGSSNLEFGNYSCSIFTNPVSVTFYFSIVFQFKNCWCFFVSFFKKVGMPYSPGIQVIFH